MTPDLLLVHLRVVGLIMAALVVVNLAIPHRFAWRVELSRLSLLNRQIFTAHAIFLVLTLALFAVLLLFYGPDLLTPTPLSRALLGGLTIFWGLRMLMQWWFYSPQIWRGHRFNTAMHYLFSAVWMYVTAVCAAAWAAAAGVLPPAIGW
jgi:hypothetical protein